MQFLRDIARSFGARDVGHSVCRFVGMWAIVVAVIAPLVYFSILGLAAFIIITVLKGTAFLSAVGPTV